MKRFNRNSFFREILKNRTLYLMFTPIAVYFILFAYIPMTGIVLAFKTLNYRAGIFGSPWSGLANFRYFFVSGKAWQVTQNTVVYNLLFLFSYTVLSVLAAILISDMTGRLFKKLTQSLMLLPYFISWVTVSALMYSLFNYEFGLINNILKAIGAQPVSIYTDPAGWHIILPALYVWKWIGFGSILYLAAIMGIDQECYEAAGIDGANAFQKISRITLPLLKPTMFILILLGVGRIMRGEFDMFFQIVGNNGLLMAKTDIIDTLVFRSLMGSADYGMAAAAGYYQSVLCFVIIVSVNFLVKKHEPDYALF